MTKLDAAAAFKDGRFVAGVDLLARSGATSFDLRWQDTNQPVVWLAVASWGDHHEVAAGLHPIVALDRLLELVLDGGKCTRCGRPLAIELTASDDLIRDIELIGGCVLRFDSESRSYARTCGA